MNPIIYYVIAIATVLLLSYFIISTLLHKEKRFRSEKVIQSGGGGIISKITQKYETSAKKKLVLTKIQRSELQDLLNRVGSELTPEDIVVKQRRNLIIAVVGFGVFGVVTQMWFFLLLGLFMGFMFYRLPLTNLVKAEQLKKEEVTKHFPDFIDLLLLLLSAGLTPYQAIEEACNQAPSALKLDCEKLKNDLQNMPDISKAVHQFAHNLAIKPADRFAIAFEQAVKLSLAESVDIFKKQAEAMRLLREQNNRQMIKMMPDKISALGYGQVSFVIIIPLAIVVIALQSAFTG